MSNFTFPAERVLDTGVAALAALSVGFVAFAMPDAIFTSLVAATPLPDLLPAARPPLGDTARYTSVAGAALGAFVSVMGLFIGIERLDRRREALPEDDEAPRVRRADAHPDAPARRPLIAGRDLGEPLELDVPADAPEAQPQAEPERRPLPPFLVVEEEREPAAKMTPEPEPEPEKLSELAARVPDADGGEDQSLPQLVNRIESGISKKRRALPSEPEAEAPEPEEEPRVGHRLRSAISELQKISAQGA